MKKQLGWLALAIVPWGIFVAARDLASWRPQTITKAEFVERTGSQPTVKPTVNSARKPTSKPQSISKSRFFERAEVPKETIDFWSESLTADAKKLKKLARSKGWHAVSLAPDKRRLLVSKNEFHVGDGVILSATNGQVLTRLAAPNRKFRDEWLSIQWSPDSQLVAFCEFEVSGPQIYNANTGELLWTEGMWSIPVRFSPDSSWAAFLQFNGEYISVREARSGREVKRLPLKNAFKDNWNFSRDSNYLLAEIAPGEFRQLRLR